MSNKQQEVFLKTEKYINKICFLLLLQNLQIFLIPVQTMLTSMEFLIPSILYVHVDGAMVKHDIDQLLMCTDRTNRETGNIF